MIRRHTAEESRVLVPVTIDLPATPVRSAHIQGVVEFRQELEQMPHGLFNFRRAVHQDVVAALLSNKQGERVKDNRAVSRRKPATDHVVKALVVTITHFNGERERLDVSNPMFDISVGDAMRSCIVPATEFVLDDINSSLRPVVCAIHANSFISNHVQVHVT